MTGCFPLYLPFQKRASELSWSKWIIRFALILFLSTSVVTMGCGTPVATWVSLGISLLNTILPTIPALITGIESLLGQTLTAAQVAKLTTIFQGASDLLTQALTALNTYEANPQATTIQQIQTILTQVKANLSNIVADVGITDAATATKIQAIAQTFIDLAQSILNILPTVTAEGKLHAKKLSQQQLNAVTPQIWAAQFNSVIKAPSGSAAVDNAFKNVKAVPAKAK